MATLTSREREIMVMAWKCFKAVSEFDYEKLRQEANLGTKASATTSYCTAKKKMLSDDTTKPLTAREREILTLAWKCFKKEPQVDYQKLKTAAQLGTVACATTSYCNAKKKLLGGDATASSTSSPATPPTKKRKAASEYETTENTPTARGKKVKAESDLEDSEEPPTPSKRSKSKSSTDVVDMCAPTADIEDYDDEDKKQLIEEWQKTKDEPVDHDLLETAREFL